MPTTKEPQLLNTDAYSLRVRLPETLARAAHRVAESRDETLSQIVRRALRAYVASGPVQTDLEKFIAADRLLDRPFRARHYKRGN